MNFLVEIFEKIELAKIWEFSTRLTLLETFTEENRKKLHQRDAEKEKATGVEISTYYKVL